MNTATLPAFAAEWVEWLRTHCPVADALALATAGLVAVRAEEGHVCVDLSQEVGQTWNGTTWPAIETWQASLLASGFVAQEAPTMPLVLDAGRLYVARLWQDEAELARRLLRLAGPSAHTPERIRAVLKQLYGRLVEDEDQHAAVATALLNRLTIIAGGPGTGKTTTVAKVLAALITLKPDNHIVLAAPTGKAAARMAEAMGRAKDKLGLDMLTLSALPEEAITLHRLLGYRPDSATPRHGPEQPLALDVLVVDEASMLDLSLFARLVAALPAHATLILLGDDEQLASVEAGNVFADLARQAGLSTEGAARLHQASNLRRAASATPSALGNGITRLSKSRRFDADSGVGALAAAIRQGEGKGAIELLQSGRSDLAWHPGTERQIRAVFLRELETHLADYRQAVAAAEPAAAWAVFQRLCILSPVREGPSGVEQLNRQAETQLLGHDTRRRPFYAGRPVIVRANAPGLGLANGDIGITLAGPDGLQVHFLTPTGWRAFLPSRLPRHDTAFVLTVHQAQGSEFNTVWLMLPDEDAPLLDRTLVYTAVTRARQRVAIWGSAATFDQAVARRAGRVSGLAKRLGSVDACLPDQASTDPTTG
ncbi:MAG: exodeoxyribonuclease V subunit alpha [Burkholderiales bacterium]|nr:exodeoxyribonuclease V subunit alpha [Burkholderiales bacterium]